MKNLCKLLVVALVITLIPSSFIFAQADNDKNADKSDFEFLQVAEALEASGDAVLLNTQELADGSTQITLEYSDGTVSSVNERRDSSLIYLTCDEGNLHDELIINNANNQMFLNGKQITSTVEVIEAGSMGKNIITEENVVTDGITREIPTWHGHTKPAYGIPMSAYQTYLGEEWHNVTFSQTVGSITLSAFVYAIFAVTGLPAIAGAVAGAFSTILAAAKNYASNDYNANYYLRIYTAENQIYPSRQYYFDYYTNSGHYIGQAVCYATFF